MRYRNLLTYLLTKVLPEPQGPRAALISVSIGLSQTPAEAASPQTRGYFVAGVSV